MNISREKRDSFYTPFLIPAAGGVLFFCAFFYLQTAFPVFLQGGINPLREGKVLFTFQGRNTALRLLSSSGRGERLHSQNSKRNRSTTSALLPAKLPVSLISAGNEEKTSLFLTRLSLLFLYSNNPTRAGPGTFFS